MGMIAIGGFIWNSSSVNTVKAQIDQTQTDRITKNEGNIQLQEKRMDKSELAQERLVGINSSIDKALVRIETGQVAYQRDQSKAQAQLVKDMATVKAKVENLERAP